MRAIDIIRRKREGGEHSAEEIAFLVAGASSGSIPDYQLAAWLMAVVLRGLSASEMAALTQAMLHSGATLDLSSLPGPKVDKHSTGGVGDKTSLLLAPIAAAGGLFVPMISGRGLGHTGGTLDKLESIPGFRTDLSLEKFRSVLAACGCAMIGQTAEIAPADKKLYALRDVTATVESPGLICASIMSKKLAEGIDALVLDVKTGSGAFMKRPEDSAHLAGLMVETGRRMGKRTAALITDMDQPLGSAVGNALEASECLAMLRGRTTPADLYELTLELAGWMFFLGKKSPSVDVGRQLAADLLAGGKALAVMRKMIELQGGDPAVCEDPEKLPLARHQREFKAATGGFVSAIACEQVGVAASLLGAGRQKAEDAIDPAVGLVLHKKVGGAVKAGEALCTLHYNEESRLPPAMKLIEQCFTIAPAHPQARPLVHGVIE